MSPSLSIRGLRPIDPPTTGRSSFLLTRSSPGPDATELPFEDQRFTGAACFTMLHHVPFAELQDRLLREVHRVLQPGSAFAGSDSTTTPLFRLAHVRDTMVLVDSDTVAGRLEAVGFTDVGVNVGHRTFRFRGRRP